MGKVIFSPKLQLFSDINLLLSHVENHREMILTANPLFFTWQNQTSVPNYAVVLGSELMSLQSGKPSNISVNMVTERTNQNYEKVHKTRLVVGLKRIKPCRFYIDISNVFVTFSIKTNAKKWSLYIEKYRISSYSGQKQDTSKKFYL